MSTRIPDAAAARAARRVSPRKTPVQERARSTVEDVLEAAAQVFDERGFASGTTNRIAERAGVSIGTLYQYFPNKQALAVALAERHLAEMMDRLAAWEGDPAHGPAGLRETLRRLVETVLAAHERRPRLHHVLLEEAPLPPAVHDEVRRAEREGARRVGAILRRLPEVRRADAHRAGATVVEIALSLTHRFTAARGGGPPRSAFVREVVDVLEGYLRRE